MKYLLFAIAVFLGIAAQAQSIALEDYLPTEVSYNQDIPKPSEVLGYVPGEWHVTHDKLVQYMTAIAESSDRISIENRGFTYEKRPLLLLTVTSKENQKNISDIRKKHLQIISGEVSESELSSMPVVVNQGFSVHGNEPSGTNAALILAYYLAAAEGPAIDELLENTIILLDPSFNPDGLQRFAYWTNTNRSTNLNPDPQDREFSEIWPGGRTNHYWFDLNRDWLPLQLLESQARVKTFYNWRPNVLTDHHEMGSNSSFFFQPGIPERTNPLTPQLNQDLTEKIGNYHAKALDSIGSLYYSKESFDDFYYGKGSTFPDINGSIGILFEQGSSRGSGQLTDNGLLSFQFTIKNQFTTALSTLKASLELKDEILGLQHQFYRNADKKAGKGAYVFGRKGDPVLANELAKVLHQHQIELYKLDKDQTIDGKAFEANSSYIIPKNQLQHRLVEAMFEERTSFKDSIFYDVSAWSFRHAFDVDFAEVKSINRGDKITEAKLETPSNLKKSPYAYAMRWSDFNSAKVLHKIMKEDIRVKVAKKPFQSQTEEFDYGTIMIPVQNQEKSADEIYSILNSLQKENHVKISALETGLTQGINLGSPNMSHMEMPKIAMLVGDGVRSYDAGEMWHMLDYRFEIPVTKLDTKDFNRASLDSYTHLIIPSSNGNALNSSGKTKLKDWVKNGGSIIAYKSTANWLKNEEMIDFKTKNDSVVAKDISFGERSEFYGAKRIGGAIFNTKVDLSHPLLYGYNNDELAIFRNSNMMLEADKLSFNNPIQYTDSPLLSGYINKENLELIKGTVPFKHNRYGRGHVMVFTDNTNFRAFWLGTFKLFLNSIFFSDQM
ncbi:M14 family metallopeptidase [Psychroflexus montanilacus]|uniref:M14 family metallopeptidase n=1 Tax=Psychroflexus montanilacus TaxID=2873598 RepID=UPI001CCF8EE6|nr:M14 family metallopeptidase [Psychroflexus montanilacus]MBZ9651641.1 M14 family metallopeptidase [Psychroflexus montanilacus]